MRKAIGTAIISNGVISRCGLKLTYEDEVTNRIFVYESFGLYGSDNKVTRDSMGLVRCLGSKTLGEDYSIRLKPNYFLASRDRIGFDFWQYGGLEDATVHVDHPKESEIIKRINELSKEFRGIRLPEHIVRPMLRIHSLGRAGTDFGLYEPLEDWAKRFVDEFSPFLPNAKLKPQLALTR